jgi:hypothetical protein
MKAEFLLFSGPVPRYFRKADMWQLQYLTYGPGGLNDLYISLHNCIKLTHSGK